MSWSWCVHVLRHFVYGRSHIRSIYGEVLQATNETAVLGGINWSRSIFFSKSSNATKWCDKGFDTLYIKSCKEFVNIFLLREEKSGHLVRE